MIENFTEEKFKKLTEKSLWWKEISDEMDRVYRTQSVDVPDEHKVVVIHALFENTFISDKLILKAEKHPVFQEAYKIISKMKVGQKFPKRIYDLSKSQLPITKRNLTKIAFEIIQKFEKQSSIEAAEKIWKYDKNRFYFDDFEVLSKILEVGNHKDRYILRSLTSIALYYLLFSQEEYDPFDSEIVFNEATVQDSTYKRASYLAYRVFNPLWDKQLYRFEPAYVDFPMKWITFLPLKFSEHLYSLYKSEKDVFSVLITYYKEKDRIYRLEDAIENCPTTQAFGEIFTEAVESYQKQRYKVASVSFLSIIEGLIWEFAWHWNKLNGGITNSSITREQFRDTTSFDLLKPDGKKVGGRPNIGKLIRKTKFGEELYVEMIEFLCEELFDERNSVLHGRNPNYGDLNKATSLLFTIESIERAITSHTKKRIGEIMEAEVISNLEKEK